MAHAAVERVVARVDASWRGTPFPHLSGMTMRATTANYETEKLKVKK